jgi:ferritin-like metal-binding protein YciE
MESMMADTETSMRVTLRDVYALVMEMRSQLEKLNQNLPNTHQKLEEHEHETSKKFDDLEVRLRKVEMRVWQIMAIAGFVSAAMPLIVRALP